MVEPSSQRATPPFDATPPRIVRSSNLSTRIKPRQGQNGTRLAPFFSQKLTAIPWTLADASIHGHNGRRFASHGLVLVRGISRAA